MSLGGIQEWGSGVTHAVPRGDTETGMGVPGGGGGSQGVPDG